MLHREIFWILTPRVPFPGFPSHSDRMAGWIQRDPLRSMQIKKYVYLNGTNEILKNQEASHALRNRFHHS